MQAIGEGRWGRPLVCGPFVGERYAGSLRWLHAGGRECVRMAGVVVRDRAWRTLLPDKLHERRQADSWTVEGRTRVGNATLAWRLSINARPRGFDLRAVMHAEGDVVTNRAGIVVLLPAATFAGATFLARHTRGGTTRGRLSRDIAPHQPVLDLGGLRIAAPDGPVLDLRFEGETFEMEDQRNWLDPSFKLYSRALSRPIPYRIRDGAQVEQRVSIDVVHTKRRARGRSVTRRRGSLPPLGIATALDRVPVERAAVEAIREVSPAFVDHRTDRRAAGLAEASRLAKVLHAALRVETFGDSMRLARALAQVDAHTVAPYFAGEGVKRVLAEHGVSITGGTFSDFVVLNRNGVAPEASRVAFALCPTVHARDDRSLIESLDTLPQLFAQARRLAGDRPLYLGPCSLLRRLVPRTGEPATQGPGSGEYDIDVRQYQLIAAAWLACVIAIAATSGADSVCTFEAEGARGLVRGKARMTRSPAHVVLAALAGRTGQRLSLLGLNALNGAAFLLEGLPAELWLVDLSGRRRALAPRFRELGAFTQVESKQGNARWATGSNRTPPYAVARIRRARAPSAELARLAQAWCEGITTS